MAITSFNGPYRFLSNFYPARVMLPDDKAFYPSVEHAYQAAKTVDQRVRVLIRSKVSAVQAKRFGQQAPLREGWGGIKLMVMENLVRQKFTRHDDLRLRLLATGNEQLIETNTWGDTFWGMCGGEGDNHLGRILMTVREEVRLD